MTTPLFSPRRMLGRTGFVATILGIGDLADRQLSLQQLNRSTHRLHTLGSVRCAHGYVALSLFVRTAHATQEWPEIRVYESLVV
jgi:hypothetical protein